MQVSVMRALKKDKMKLLLIAITIILLSGCSQGSSNGKTENLILPSVIQYSQAKQDALASELQTGGCPVSKDFLIDYGIMREQTREAMK